MPSSSDSQPVLATSVCLARQPIFDRNLDVVAYELLYRSSQHQQTAGVADNDEATSQVLANTLVEFGLDQVVGSLPAFVNFAASFILNGHCAALPADRLVIELLEGAEPTDALVAALEGLVQAGFQLALDDFVFLPGYERLLQLASIVKIDLRLGQDQFADALARLEQYPVHLLAEKVETPEEYDLCRDLGFSYFQGYFFAKPRLVAGRQTPSDRLTTLRLIAALNAPDISLKEVESLIGREPTIAQKLLKFINSTHVGLRMPVKSIGTAVGLVGQRNLRTWATLLTLGGLTHCPREVLVTANVRGRMCESLAEAGGQREAGPYFTVGLFSVLDVLAGRPMDEILAELPLADDVKLAITERGGPFGQKLATVLDYESRLATSPNQTDASTDAGQLAKSYLDAVTWTDSIFAELTV